MSEGRLFLIHWNTAEAEGYARELRDLGWQVALESEDGARAATAIKAEPPDAILIYHTRLPSHGRRTAAYLAESRAARAIPVVFVGGEGEALQKTKASLPQATFLSEDELEAHLAGLAAA